MGVVYLAEDMKLKRKVAIKFLTLHISANKEEKERFEIEAQAAASLNHPNITTVYSIEEADDEVFIVMEYIEGAELKAKIKSESKITEEAINIAIQIAEGLDAAHKKRIVHRDIKSQNIMITDDNKVKIMDFGLAKLKGGLQITKIGSTVGTVAYMSPEQARGEKVDQRTDIWSFGIVLYEMLTGELPFKGEYEQALIYSIINENPKPISAVNRVIPIEFEQIIDKAMAKNPVNRYQNAEEIISDLKQLLLKISNQTTTDRKRIKLYAGKKLIIPGIIALFIILIIILAAVLSSEGNHKIKSIAVLPLANLSHNPEQEYFVDGMTDALITELSKISGLRVISRTSVMQYKDKKEHLPDIAEELGVDAVVEGSALLINNKIRITAQLIDAVTDEHIWSNLYDRKLADVLSLHKKVAMEIAQEIRIKLSAEEQKNLSDANQVNPKAYELLLKGRYIFKNKSHLEDRLKSIEYYKKAIKIDSGFSLAYAYLANAIRYLTDYGYPPPNVKEQVKQAAIKSIELDPNSAIAHMQYGMYKFYFEWDWQTALKELKRALELEPNNADIYAGLASYYGNIGEYEKGFEFNSKAQSLSPLAMDLKNQKVWLYFQSRKYKEGLNYVDNLIDLESQNPGWILWRILFYSAKNDCKKAIPVCSQFESLIKGSDNQDIHEALAIIAWTNAKCGNQNKAKNYLNKLLSIKHWIDPGEIALAYIGLGNNYEAIKWIKKAIRQKTKYCFYIKHAPVFDFLKNNPDFNELIAGINLP